MPFWFSDKILTRRFKGSLQAHKTEIEQPLSVYISLKFFDCFSFDNTHSHVTASAACNADSQRGFFPHVNNT